MADATTPKPSRRVQLVCKHCGSTDLVRDAAARWSVAEQTWELSSTYDDTTCEQCGAEGHDVIAEAELAP